ncbi:MAG: efflux RND transporter periplasmic adaptor subunit [Rhodothermia bacterium]|nr:MAG: efflux RND transporter periplasmic adaptor subunit [Rhodothermia bacterium]
MNKFIVIALVLIVGSGFVWYSTRGDGPKSTSYRFVQVERGDLESVVASTGNLRPVTMVKVGTQVSGIVNRLYVDFNDEVRRGQLIATIDTTLLVTAIQESETSLLRNQAQLNYAQTEYDRIKGLHAKSFATDVELNKAVYDLQIASATLKSGELNLQRAERNLSYANIYSPVDGVVIERNVDEGQTVAASLSAPQLFLIAEDLSKLQILTSVDESDIGKIKEGQTARFTVQAHDDLVFEGTVKRVRLQSSIQENVVTYTVVVNVNNDDGQLLPGMTATVEFLVETVSNVLKVPNAGLRFRPTEEMIAELISRMTAQREAEGDSTRAGGRNFGGREGRQSGGPAGFQGNRFGGGQGRPNMAQLWSVDDEGNLTVSRVRTGITDGQSTEVIGRNIESGMNVIAGITQGSIAETNSNPFQQQRQGRRRPGSF